MMSPGLTENPDHRVTTRGIRLLEPGYPDRIYIPQEDIQGPELIKFNVYQCPLKGMAVWELFRESNGTYLFVQYSVQRGAKVEIVSDLTTFSKVDCKGKSEDSE